MTVGYGGGGGGGVRGSSSVLALLVAVKRPLQVVGRLSIDVVPRYGTKNFDIPAAAEGAVVACERWLQYLLCFSGGCANIEKKIPPLRAFRVRNESSRPLRARVCDMGVSVTLHF